MPESTRVAERIARLKTHLQTENPHLLDAVNGFTELDKVAHATGMLPADQSFATQVPWWPVIALLGTYSAGKSTFINSYLGQPVQSTGSQAVDDRFTVICYGPGESQVLPGIALDADPRFPFYQSSEDIEAVAQGEGRRVDAYLQLKTSQSERLRGKLIIDSPGFDADEQRTATLRITDHIIALADLVLVFFDARHPEPGAMQDTLEHLVGRTINRPDSSKFLYVLNQIDNAAREDNLEEVFAAWQRALARQGLSAGRYFQIYDAAAAIDIKDPAINSRFAAKREADISTLHARMEQVEIDRAYRVAAMLEETAKGMQNTVIPAVEVAHARWTKRVASADAVLLVIGVALGWRVLASADTAVSEIGAGSFALLGALSALLVFAHTRLRDFFARWESRTLRKTITDEAAATMTVGAFSRTTRLRHSIWRKTPVGWTRAAKKRIDSVRSNADALVQRLNDTYTNPAGHAVDKARSKEETSTPS
ncbi:MAG: dynamin family protein [Gammaproteobacteria bacterium]|nr:dynamin family protein [Gammaproteobacteria bacterium]